MLSVINKVRPILNEMTIDFANVSGLVKDFLAYSNKDPLLNLNFLNDIKNKLVIPFKIRKEKKRTPKI